ncbi:MAG: hypothetical protein CM15mP49_25250 [Actinomycetota bacterium]|nr:MAG: hypothetical protein CM15mP49_25250 [Actinomycetota bacterium]
MGLNKRGIVTFLQIANLTDQEVADIEEDLISRLFQSLQLAISITSTTS